VISEHYEKTNFPIDDPDPIEHLEHVMQSRGLTRKDFEPAIGQRGRVAEIFNRVRP
jgi:HTH-type transcriptional regulator/antitoxin HigA